MSVGAARWLDRLGQGESPVHRLDARAKLLATAAFVVAVASFPKYEVAALLPFAALPLALWILARVPARPLLGLLAAGSPFALMVGLGNPFLDRAPRAELWGLPLAGGWLSFGSILLRYALCTSAALLLVATSSMPALASGLARLRFPRAFVAQVQLLHRYLFLVVEEGRRLAQARALREPARRLPRLATARRMLGSLLARALERGERVHGCMRARGFDGGWPLLAPRPFRATDALFLASVLLACAALRALPVARWLGRAALAAAASLTGGGS